MGVGVGRAGHRWIDEDDAGVDHGPLAVHHHFVQAQVRTAGAVDGAEPDDHFGLEVDGGALTPETSLGPQPPVGGRVEGDACSIGLTRAPLVGQQPPAVTLQGLRTRHRRLGRVDALEADRLGGEPLLDGRDALLLQDTDPDTDDAVARGGPAADREQRTDLLGDPALERFELGHRPRDADRHDTDIGELLLQLGLAGPRVLAERG